MPIDASSDLDLDVLLTIFGRWRLEEGEEVIDLADYAHIDQGPGCLLISHRWQFGIDQAAGKRGLFYSTRKDLSGSLADRFAQAIQGLVTKSARLLAEKEFPSTAKILCGELEIIANDRMLLPNTDASDAEVRPELDKTLGRLYGSGSFQVERETDSSRRLGYGIQAKAASGLSLDDLSKRLS
jgi:hypothetical protein